MTDHKIGEPLGPGGIAARMAEIQAEIQSRFGNPIGAPASFSTMLQTQMPGGLAGQIGAGGPLDYRPVSPFGAGSGVVSDAPPALRALTQQTARNNGIDPDLLEALVQQESGYSVTARSKVGAMGLTQIMPDTATSLGVKNPFDPAQNLDAGAKYLKQQIERFGDLGLALAAYNAGPNAVARHGGIPPYPETQAYVKSILSRMEVAKGGHA